MVRDRVETFKGTGVIVQLGDVAELDRGVVIFKGQGQLAEIAYLL